MVIEYSFPRISFISSYIITNKTLILYLFCKRRSSYFSVAELAIITEVKFIGKFLQAMERNG